MASSVARPDRRRLSAMEQAETVLADVRITASPLHATLSPRPSALPDTDWNDPERTPIDLTIVVPTFNEIDNVQILLDRLHQTLGALGWQVIFVDDDSPDGTAARIKTIARANPHVVCLRRIGRRGLAGAVIEGALASAAPWIAVMDADLQHDERVLLSMLAVRSDAVDLVIASRYLDSAEAKAGLSPARLRISRLAVALARHVLRAEVTDPVSGFFMIRRSSLDAVASRLSTTGFKVLFDIIASANGALRIIELPYAFRPRSVGISKFSRRAAADYFSLVMAKATRDVLSARAVLFGLVGLGGLGVQLGVLDAVLTLAPHLAFPIAQTLAAITAMSFNFLLNNSLTYRDRRRRGLSAAVGYLKFCAFCSVGLIANVAVATVIQRHLHLWWSAGCGGAVVGAAWNYLTTAVGVW